MTGSYHCPCGWSRAILDWETIDDARVNHERTEVHRLAMAEFPPGVDMCRDCGGAHVEGECPLDCEHKNVSQEDWGGEERAFLCLDCDNWVSPTGPEDEEGHPTWEIQ